MNETSPEQRKSWYRHFPEGSLEFLVATRVLAVVLLLAMIVMHDIQRPMILTALIGVLWFDYVLVLWWAIQVRLDLNLLASRQETGPKRWVLGLKVFLPSTIAAYALAPWPSAYGFAVRIIPGLARQGGPHSPAYHHLTLIGFSATAVLFVVLAVVAHRALQRVQLGRPLWTAFLFVPGAHWFAAHRIAADLDRRIHEQRAQRTGSIPPTAGSASMAAADVTWALCMLPWLIVLAVTIVHGWPSKPFPFCGMSFAAIFAVADLAALERVQRHFVHLVREP